MFDHKFYNQVVDRVRVRRAHQEEKAWVQYLAGFEEGGPVKESEKPKAPPVAKYITTACVHPDSLKQWRKESRPAVQLAPQLYDTAGGDHGAAGGGSVVGSNDSIDEYDLAEQCYDELPEAGVIVAPVSVKILVEGETYRIPAHTWLLLEPKVGVAADSGVNGNPLRLSEAATGGTLMEGDGSGFDLITQLPSERLTMSAAEANFSRTVRGTSLFALRHAACILGLLGPHQETGANLLTPGSEAEKRLRRAEPAVIARAAAVVRRDARAAAAVKRGASPNSGTGGGALAALPPPPLPTADSGLFSRKAKLQRGRVVFREFLGHVTRRFGNVVRAWFVLDRMENMRLGQRQFHRGCEEIHFKGDVQALWQYLDADGTGCVGLLELDIRGSLLLASFKRLVEDKFKEGVLEFFEAVDTSQTNRLGRLAFADKLSKLGFKENAQLLFELLDRKGLGCITPDYLEFLARWRLPPYVFAGPSGEVLSVMKKVFADVASGSMLRAWRKLFDTHGTMRVSWDTFCQRCADLARSRDDFPQQQGDIASAWRAMDEHCKGWIGLREFDAKSFEALSEFKRWADRQHGSVVRAFHFLDTSNARLSEGELRRATKGRDGCKADMELLFDGLDTGNAWVLTEQDVKFIDEWDLEWEDWEFEARKACFASDVNVGSVTRSPHHSHGEDRPPPPALRPAALNARELRTAPVVR